MDHAHTPYGEAATGEGRALLDQATINLSDITAAVDRLGERPDVTMELLEASRCLHNALAFLADVPGGDNDEEGMGEPTSGCSSAYPVVIDRALYPPIPRLLVRETAVAADATATSSLSDIAREGTQTAFVLGGGGSLGSVQVGMLRALLERGIRPDFVVGASIGSLNGAYLAGHLDLDGVQGLGELWSSVRRTDVFRINLRRLVAGVIGHGNYLFDVLGLRAIIERAGLGFERLEEAPIPVHAVATDIMSGKPVVLSQGDAIDALLASSAIPGIFPPVKVGGRLLVDGGVLANLPVTQAIELGATRLFVLPAITCESAIATNGALNMMQRSMLVATSALALDELTRVVASTEVHVLPVPATAQGSIFDFRETEALIEDAYLSSLAWLGAAEYELVS